MEKKQIFKLELEVERKEEELSVLKKSTGLQRNHW